MSNSIFTEHKLIILYFLSNLNSSINLSEITTFLIEYNYTDYLQAGQYLAELADSGLVNVYQKDNKVLYKINDQGKQTLELFSERLSNENRKIIENYLIDLKDISTNSIHTSFNYLEDDNKKFKVLCTVAKDKEILFEINIPNTEKEDIDKIKDKWETNKLTIMKTIKENLL